jgi:hypothetical protein
MKSSLNFLTALSIPLALIFRTDWISFPDPFWNVNRKWKYISGMSSIIPNYPFHYECVSLPIAAMNVDGSLDKTPAEFLGCIPNKLTRLFPYLSDDIQFGCANMDSVYDSPHDLEIFSRKFLGLFIDAHFTFPFMKNRGRTILLKLADNWITQNMVCQHRIALANFPLMSAYCLKNCNLDQFFVACFLPMLQQ